MLRVENAFCGISIVYQDDVAATRKIQNYVAKTTNPSMIVYMGIKCAYCIRSGHIS